MPRIDTRRTAGTCVCLPLAAGLFLLAGCPGETPTAGKPGKTGAAANGGHDGEAEAEHEHHHHHADKGPHGGALVAIGADDAHVELVLDGETGKLTAYVLDGEAEKPVAIKQASLQLGITLPDEDAGEKTKGGLPKDVFPLMLAAVDPQDGKASEFSGTADELKGVEHFDAALTSISVGDKSFKNVSFSYPEGNEHEH
jgi:hypothetical protein